MPKGTCSIGDCEKPVKCRGWCRNHYDRWLRYGDPLGGTPSPRPAPPDGLCTVDDCDSPHYARGWCNRHYLHWRHNGDPLRVLPPAGGRPVAGTSSRADVIHRTGSDNPDLAGMHAGYSTPRKKAARTCEINDCVKPHYARGWCETHYTRWRKSGNPLVTMGERRLAPVDGRCTVSGCREPHLARGLCGLHYQRWNNHGDPLAVPSPAYGPDNPGWKGDQAGYGSKHRRVEIRRGKARLWACIWEGIEDAFGMHDACSGRMHWANMTGNYGDFWDFEPACALHHVRFDAARARALSRLLHQARAEIARLQGELDALRAEAVT